MKASFKRFFDFLLFGNIYIAFGAFCLVQSTIIQLDLADRLLPYSTLVFFATLFVYNFQRMFYTPHKDDSLHSVRRAWIFANGGIIKTLVLIGFTGVAISFFYVDLDLLFYLSPLLILSLAYFSPLVKLRKNAFFKLLTLVSVWTVVTAVLPILIAHVPLLDDLSLFHIAIRALFMLGICIPFDIRDLKIDMADKIATLPILLGETVTRWMALICMVLYNLLIIQAYHLRLMNIKLIVPLLCSAIINTLLVFFTNSKRSEYYFIAGIDGTMILQGATLMLFFYFRLL